MLPDPKHTQTKTFFFFSTNHKLLKKKRQIKVFKERKYVCGAQR